ncbi:S8 family serine peptidase [Nocardiopsis sp. L17-MgMaSL7]|uniref:S8 family serine peptidase n=1 Tax=Nocardiopsis sp. L17-MgMaSL7 TaxID=1938893 RepID=UPI000D70DB52|nr:S8 family serine peptidase [Nocardiopsis sp. L17-MgMaSL7]PWV52300.1 subtilase family protein [Nocardiopsis sp. L17-MgMaSL7]
MLGGNSRSRTHQRHVLGATAGACAALTVLGLTAVPAAADVPDFRPEQWALASIGAPEAWETSQGQGVTVALPGVSVDEDHPDLRDNLVVDTEFGTNGNDTDPGTAAGALVVGHGHGMDADGGVLGVAPAARLLVLPTDDGPAEVIGYAVEQGAQVVLLQDEVEQDEDLQTATASAARSGTLVVAPAGGEADPNVLAVGGVDEEGALLPDSPPAESIDLLAPGAELSTAGPDMGQTDVTGTPYAAAVAAGAAALLTSEYPQLGAEQLRDALVEGSQQGGQGLASLYLPSAVAQASGNAQDMPLVDDNLVQDDSPTVPVWMWFALVGVVLALIVILLVLWVRRTSKDPYGVAAERQEEDQRIAAERAEQARAEERPSRRKGGRRRKK